MKSLIKLNLCVFFLVVSFLTTYAQKAPFGEKTKDSTLQNDETLYQVIPDYDFIYKKPKKLQWVKNSFKDIGITFKSAFKKENRTTMALIAASTALFIIYDQDIIDASQQFGDFIGLSHKNRQHNIMPSDKMPIYVPTDLASGLYYIGDGWTHMTISACFYTYGLTTGDARALQTSSQLTEGMAATGLITQLLKHISGRESPFTATRAGGRWDFLPNQEEYHKHVPHYDAFPSGHLATSMMTVTIIAENYPEYKFIRPVGYSMMGLLAYQMMNNGVHWMSDYPLALAIGYTVGKAAVKRGRKIIKRQRNIDGAISHKPQMKITPIYIPGGIGVGFSYRF